jgi:hypothetical protein
MALQPCYECNKEISAKALTCPQCGAPQNPVSGLMDNAKGFFSKKKKAFMKGVEEGRKKNAIREKLDDLENRLQDMDNERLSYNLPFFDDFIAGDHDLNVKSPFQGMGKSWKGGEIKLIIDNMGCTWNNDGDAQLIMARIEQIMENRGLSPEMERLFPKESWQIWEDLKKKNKE